MGYISNFFRNLFHSKISIFAFIKNSSINKESKIYYLCKIANSKIGKFTYIAPKVEICNSEIGSFCSIAKNVHIGLAEHPTNFKSTSPIFYNENNALKVKWCKGSHFDEFKTTIIGNDVWIGLNALIKCGIKIGNGAIIAAGAVVTKDVPPYAIVGGVPAKIIRYRFDTQTINKLLEEKWWDKSEEILKQNLIDFEHPIR